MAIPSKTNYLNYTGQTHEDMEVQIANKMEANKEFETFSESTIAQTIIEIFTGSTDMVNYALERRSEECFLDTAKLKSSVMLLAKQLGYVITRPIPAKTALNMRLYGNLAASGVTVGTTIPLTKFNSTFTHNGFNYIMINSLEYTVTQDDLDQGADLDKTISYAYVSDGSMVPDILETDDVSDIVLYQGDITVKTYEASSNAKLSQLFQIYKLDDPKFSNLYGDEDLSYNSDDETFDLLNNITKIGIASDSDTILGAAADEDNLYQIDRKSLINQESLGSYGDAKKLCYVRTSMDGNVEILFGDNNFAALGPQTITDNLYVQYFATDGINANAVGVIGDILTPNQNIISEGDTTGINMNKHIEFTLKRNIIAGAGLEDIDSIRYSAPGSYAANDRAVTNADYKYLLKGLTSPINVKNAIAWGEQEESRANNVKAILAMFNVIFYSVLGEIYNINSTGVSKIKPLEGSDSLQDSAVLEGEDYDPYDVVSSFSYFNLFIRQSLPSEVGRIDFLSTTHPIRLMKSKVDAKSLITIENVYTSPIIQDFKVSGTVYVNNLADKLAIRTKANNSVYNFLNENADFHIAIYKSNISELIEIIPEVKYLNIEFTPVYNELEILSELRLEPGIVDNEDSVAITNIMSSNMNNFMEYAGYAYSGNTEMTIDENYIEKLDVATWEYFATDWILENKQHQRIDNITERTFLNKLIKPMYDEFGEYNANLKIFRESDEFKVLIRKMHNSLTNIIKSSMLDENGNIINYSMRSEIARLDLSDLNYVFAN